MPPGYPCSVCSHVRCLISFSLSAVRSRQRAPTFKLSATGPVSLSAHNLRSLQAGQTQDALQVFRHCQDLGLLTTGAYWCELIDAFARRAAREKGAVSNQLPFQLWRELCLSGLPLDARGYVTGVKQPQDAVYTPSGLSGGQAACLPHCCKTCM